MSNRCDTPPSAAVYGCAGAVLTAEERAFYRDADPLGFILFRRNVESPDQVRALTSALRDCVGRDAPVLVDQEGGRVARLRPPHWPALPPARQVGLAAEDGFELGRRAAWLHGRLLAHMLHDLGIDVDCAPVADVATPDTHEAIGDRAFAGEPALVAVLARAQAQGLLSGGVLPVLKHMPGHGRAKSDSHKEPPVVDAPRDALEARDFAPFRDLADLPLGMVAHVVYTAVDPMAPSSASPVVIRDVVRGWIGFDGLLFSDDIGMEALSGTHGQRAAAVLAGGCDVALHCSGLLAEMVDVAAHVPAMTSDASRRWARAEASRRPPEPVDTQTLRAELDGILMGGMA